MLPSLRLLLTILGVFVAGIHRVLKANLLHKSFLWSVQTQRGQPPPKKKGGRRFQIPRYLHDDLVNFCYTYINSQPVKSRHFRLVILDFFRPPVPAEQTQRLLQAMNQLPRPLMVQHLGPTQKRGWTGGSWFMVLIDSYSSLIFFKFLVSPVSSTDIHVLSVSCVPNVEYNR